MAVKRDYALKWELAGIPIVFLLGGALHFVFEWSGESRVVALLAPVNESVWEHFKLGFLPMCLFAAVEYGYLRGRVNNFAVAKAAAVYLIPLIVGLVFYGYEAIIGREILAVDILIFLAAIIAAQYTGYRIMLSGSLPGYVHALSVVFIIILAGIYMLATFYPPHLPIFMDGNTGAYGIP